MALTYQLIASNTLTSSAASVTFSSIPGTYTDLVLRVSARRTGSSTTGENLWLNINSYATGTTYSHTILRGDGSAASSGRSSNNSKFMLVGQVNGGGTTSNTFGNLEIYIPDYAGSNNKVVSAYSAVETNSATIAYSQMAVAGLWRQTSAITSLALDFFDSGDFASGSSFFLYGIKKN